MGKDIGHDKGLFLWEFKSSRELNDVRKSSLPFLLLGYPQLFIPDLFYPLLNLRGRSQQNETNLRRVTVHMQCVLACTVCS